MTAKEIQQNRTQGTWVKSGVEVGSILPIPIGGTICSCYQQRRGEENLANAEAITSAINATYGAGIDPACVVEAFKMLEEAAKYLKGNKSSLNIIDLTSLLERAKI